MEWRERYRRYPSARRGLVAAAAALAMIGCGANGNHRAAGRADGRDATGGGDAVGREVSSRDTAPDVVRDVARDVGASVDAASCRRDADCASLASGPCDVATCQEGHCVLAVAPDGRACDDGDACTTGDTCTKGRCLGHGVDCDDANPCTTDGCDPASGCVYTFNQRPCDDGTACTVGDHCFEGSCQGTALDCDDGNPCTDDSCDPKTGCQWHDNTASCDDGDACTGGDQCAGGVCVSGALLDCGHGNPCVSSACGPKTGCSLTPLYGTCDDGNACTTEDRCEGGVCTGSPVDCDDHNPCTDDACDPKAGCTHTDNTHLCDDGDTCTRDDACHDGACVSGSPVPGCCRSDTDCDDQDPCTDDRCVDGACTFLAKTCDDQNACTIDACADGVCTHEAAGPVRAGTDWTDDFEGADALNAWHVESDNTKVTWQIDPTRAHGGTQSLYCGDLATHSYDYGETTATATRMLTIPPGHATLHLWAFINVDEQSCSFDVTRVSLGGQALAPALCATLGSWTEETWDVSQWAGRTVVFQLRFVTGDPYANRGEGVWIDDLSITIDSPPACCTLPSDCAGDPGRPCTRSTCQNGTCGLDTSGCSASP